MYVKLTSNGFLHIAIPGRRTKCGRDYAHLDYLPVSEDELDNRHHAICHKCQNKRREGPRTIKEALAITPYEKEANKTA